MTKPERLDRDRPGLFDRLQAFRSWFWKTWSEEAVMIYRRSARGRKRFQVLGVELLLFVREVIREFWAVQGTSRAASLAYTTLLSLIPLVVAFSMAIRSYFSRVFPDIQAQADTIFNIILPYQAPQIAYHLNRFAENAEAASTFGAIVFLLISFRLFMAVEATFNQIWHVEAARGYRQRFRAFTMLLFWGPILLGLSLMTSASLEKNPYMRLVVERTGLPSVLPIFVLFVGFTMLFWLVPATRVRLSSAILGAGITTLLFELLRFGFGAYAQILLAGRLNVIYGTLGLLIIFLLLLEFLWIVILLGVQISQVHQNLQGVLRASEQQLQDQPEYDLYYAVRVMIEIAIRFERREPPPSSYRLAEELGTTDPQMERVLRQLERAGLANEIAGEWPGWVPGGDPDRIGVEEVLDAIDGTKRAVPADRQEPAGLEVAELFHFLDNCTSEALRDRSVGRLVRHLRGEPPPSRASDGSSADPS